MELTPAQTVAILNELIDSSSVKPSMQNLYRVLAARQWLDAIGRGELILTKPAPANDVPKE